MPLFNALIRTHHITSRKKVSKLRQAAGKHQIFAFLRSGGAPGLMYAEGLEQGVREWVNAVHGLRYKDYRLAVKPAQVVRDHGVELAESELELGKLEECDSVKSFADGMSKRDVYGWWRRGMGFEGKEL